MSADPAGRTREAAEAWLTSYRIFAVTQPHGYHRTGPHGTTEVITGAPMAHLNGIASVRRDPDVDEIAAFANSPRLGSLEWSIHVRGEAGERLAAIAGSHGLERRWTLPFMMKSLGEGDSRRPGGEPAIRRVFGNDGDLYRRALAASFEAPAEFYALASSHAVMDYRDSRAYVVEIDGETVATSYGILVDDMVGLYNVAVPPRWRGRGYARIATEAILRDAFGAGAHTAFLHATTVGLPLYQAIGFQVAEKWTLFTAIPGLHPENLGGAHNM
jgi:ribosomal protein S18 acetylase RimI-like enzyme